MAGSSRNSSPSLSPHSRSISPISPTSLTSFVSPTAQLFSTCPTASTSLVSLISPAFIVPPGSPASIVSSSSSTSRRSTTSSISPHSPNYPISPRSPGSRSPATSPILTNGWMADPDYHGHYIKYIKPYPGHPNYARLMAEWKERNKPHPLLQACTSSLSTTSISRSPPDLSIMIPRIPTIRSFPVRSASRATESSSGTNSHSSLTDSQHAPTPSPNFLKQPNNTIPAESLFKLLTEEPLNVLLFDLRPRDAYEVGYISQAINVTAPMRKLKKTSFTLGKLIKDFIGDEDQESIARWSKVNTIVAYDNHTRGPTSPVGTAVFYLLEKFRQEGWEGQSFVLEGGFKDFAEEYPNNIAVIPYPEDECDPVRPLSGDESGNSSPVALAYGKQGDILREWRLSKGKNLPNRDSWDDVEEISIALPANMAQQMIDVLPSWLLKVYGAEGSKLIAEKFRLLEHLQVQRFKGTYSIQVLNSSSPSEVDPTRYLFEGCYTREKNRYRDIYPYEHSRVVLSDFEDQDYINASHLSVQNSSKRYIASQAPMPAAFTDFWNMVWEQEVNVIVMLTVMEEALRTVAHKYWTAGQYGPLKLTLVSDQMILLNEPEQDTWYDMTKPKPVMHYISVRKFALEHRDHPFSAIRGITQIQDLAWPDFGVPDDPGHILRLIDYVNKLAGSHLPSENPTYNHCSPITSSPRKPVIVQCSAGCGRTGVFCTLDALVEQLERHLPRQKRDDNNGPQLKIQDDDDSNKEGVCESQEDLIENIVSRFRDERMSMVQNLRQFMHCYEVALEWFNVQGQKLGYSNAKEKGGEGEESGRSTDSDWATSAYSSGGSEDGEEGVFL